MCPHTVLNVTQNSYIFYKLFKMFQNIKRFKWSKKTNYTPVVPVKTVCNTFFSIVHGWKPHIERKRIKNDRLLGYRNRYRFRCINCWWMANETAWIKTLE